MMLNQLICRAASVYPDAHILQYFDLNNHSPAANPSGGDTLARYIVEELVETFEPGATDGDQIAAAVKVMQAAADELATVAHALNNLGDEKLAA